MSPAVHVIARCVCKHERSEHVRCSYPDGKPGKCLHEGCKCQRLDIIIRGRER